MILCVEFSQVQYIDLSDIVHVVKTGVIVTSVRQDLMYDVNAFCDCYFSRAEVSPEWRLKLRSGTKKKCPFP